MTSESSEPDEDLAWHREMDMNAFWDDGGEFVRSRVLDDLVRVSEDAGLYDEFDDEPTHEKWRRGAKWK